MAAEAVTPLDPFSGIPIPLAPHYMASRDSRFKPDWHHSWHERNNPLLKDSVGGVALRHSRVQYVNYDAHHLDYHAVNFAGPPLPENDTERLRPIILAAAGYVPEYALAFAGAQKAPILNQLSKQTRDELWQSGKIKVEHPTKIRAFLLQVTLGQELCDVKDSTIDEFLHTTDTKRRWVLGNDLLGRLARQAAEPVTPYYAAAYKAELIPHDIGHHAGRFVLRSLGLRRHRDTLHERLKAKLAA